LVVVVALLSVSVLVLLLVELLLLPFAATMLFSLKPQAASTATMPYASHLHHARPRRGITA
jgi:hypothetical protein